MIENGQGIMEKEVKKEVLIGELPELGLYSRWRQGKDQRTFRHFRYLPKQMPKNEKPKEHKSLPTHMKNQNKWAFVINATKQYPGKKKGKYITLHLKTSCKLNVTGIYQRCIQILRIIR